MNVNMRLLKKISKLLVMGAAISAILPGCGGGSGSTDLNNPAFIVASVTWYAAPISTYGALVSVETDSANHIPIADATVTVNGVPLTYIQNNAYYLNNNVVPDGSGNFALSVTANGTTYTSTQSAITAPPVFTSVFTSFSASTDNTVTWTAPAGVPAPGNGMYYNLEIREHSFIPTMYTSGLISALDTVVPADTARAGIDYTATISGTRVGPQIANAATGSNFSISSISSPVTFTAKQ